MALTSREISSSSKISHHMHLLPQHLTYVPPKCELHLLLSSSQDNPKTCAMFFHRHNILLLLIYLFLFLWGKSFYYHYSFLENFLLSQSDYVVYLPHLWDFVPCLGKFPCLCSNFYPVVFTMLPGQLLFFFQRNLICILCCYIVTMLSSSWISYLRLLMYLETFSSSLSLCPALMFNLKNSSVYSFTFIPFYLGFCILLNRFI
jgi:hypothetical protein